MIQRTRFVKGLLVVLASAFIGLMSADQALGQGAVTTATVTGDVLDKTGAVLPGAKVTVKNQATGLAREITSDNSGHFIAAQLPVGSYEVDIELPGFKKVIIRDVLLNVGATETLKVTLEVGELVESVDVSAETVVGVETTKIEVSSVIQEVQVRELPLNQRSFTALVTQQAGLVVMTNATTLGPASTLFSQGSQISANGQVTSSMAYLMDGVSIGNSGYGAPGTVAAGDIPGVEAIQEFKVVTHNYSAAYGGSAGAVVSFATRSGTNTFHGSVYEFLRNDALDARGPFDTLDRDRDGKAELPPFRRNQFGATFGGPIKRDRTFFFANYEGLRQRLTTTEVGFVPSLAARTGGVGGTSGFPVIGPIRQPDGTYKRGPVAISDGVRALLDRYPLPNGRDFGNGIAQHIYENPQPIRQDFLVGKIDHNLSQNDLLSGRYSLTDADASNAYQLPNQIFGRENRLQNFVLKWTRTFSANLVNTASIGFARSFILANPFPLDLKPSHYTGNPERKLLGTVTVGTVGSGNVPGTFSNLGTDSAGQWLSGRNSFPINDDVIYTRGDHVFKFGGMINRRHENLIRQQLVGGIYQFRSVNDFLAANPVILIIRKDGANQAYGYRTTQFAWYVEDAWRIRRNFTVTAGLRHEFQAPVFSEVNGKLGNEAAKLFSNTNEPINNFTKTQFQPRLGIAYDPFDNGKTVIRAGIGLFNDYITDAAGNMNPLNQNGPGPVLNAAFGEPNAPDRNVFPVIPFPHCPSCTVPTGFDGIIPGILLPIESPSSIQWHLQIERQLPAQLKFSVAYTGSQSYHVPRAIEGNYNLPSRFENGQPIFVPSGGKVRPDLSSRAFTYPVFVFDSNANFHGVTFELNRAFSRGLTFYTSYTFGKAISELDTVNSAILENLQWHSQNPFDRKGDRGESSFSIRHRFTINGIYELPFGQGKPFLSNVNGITNALLGGWSLNALGEFRSGYPFSIATGFGITGVGDAIALPDRPNILRANSEVGRVDQWFDPKAFALQDPGRLGNAPRNPVRGPGFNKLDFSLIKKFRAGERMGVEFRAEFFNVLNHPNFGLPFHQLYIGGVRQFDHVPTQAELDALPCNLTAAQAQTTSCNPRAGTISRTVSTPRQLQFGLKVTF